MGWLAGGQGGEVRNAGRLSGFGSYAYVGRKAEKNRTVIEIWPMNPNSVSWCHVHRKQCNTCPEGSLDRWGGLEPHGSADFEGGLGQDISMTVHPPELVGRQVGCSWRAVAACSSMAKARCMVGMTKDIRWDVGLPRLATWRLGTPLILVQKVVDVDRAVLVGGGIGGGVARAWLR